MNVWDPNAPMPVHEPADVAPTAPLPQTPEGPLPNQTQPVQLKRNEGASKPAAPLQQKPTPVAEEEEPKKRSMLLPILGVIAALLLVFLGVRTALLPSGNLSDNDRDAGLAALDTPVAEQAVPKQPVPEQPVPEQLLSAGSDLEQPEAAQAPIKTPAVATQPKSEPVRSPPARSEPARSEPLASPATSQPKSTPKREARQPRESSSSAKSAPATFVQDDLIAELGEDTGTPAAINLDGYADNARTGRLSASDVMNLEMVDSGDSSYTRSRALLLMNAEQDQDIQAAKRYLDQLMVLPENRYNSVYLSKQAVWYVNRGSYSQALETANQAERYWARIPSELVFGTKADIYETKASSYQGLFYASEDDLDLLDQAVSGWSTYKRHMSSKGSAAEAERAQGQINKLENIRKRLE
jgi:hypothetical protein